MNATAEQFWDPIANKKTIKRALGKQIHVDSQRDQQLYEWITNFLSRYRRVEWEAILVAGKEPIDYMGLYHERLHIPRSVWKWYILEFRTAIRVKKNIGYHKKGYYIDKCPYLTLLSGGRFFQISRFICNLDMYNGFDPNWYSDIWMVGSNMEIGSMYTCTTFNLTMQELMFEVSKSWWRLVKKYHYSMKISKGCAEWAYYVHKYNKVVELVKESKWNQYELLSDMGKSLHLWETIDESLVPQLLGGRSAKEISSYKFTNDTQIIW